MRVRLSTWPRVDALAFLRRSRAVLSRFAHRRTMESLGGRRRSRRIPRQLVPVLSPWSHSRTLEYPVMLHAILSAVLSCDPLWQRSVASAGLEGEGDEAAFNQRLAPHKAFITPKRLRLPKPERDKHCPFICNDVEARSNWTELRGRGELCHSSVDGLKGTRGGGQCF